MTKHGPLWYTRNCISHIKRDMKQLKKMIDTLSDTVHILEGHVFDLEKRAKTSDSHSSKEGGSE